MKKVIKSLVMVFFIFMICGCDIKYDIRINQDMSVDDKINVVFPTAYAEFYFQEPKEYVNNIYKAKSEEFGISGYSVKSEIGDDESTAYLNSSSASIESYINNSPLKMLYENINVSKENGDIKIKMTKMNDVFSTIVNYDAMFVLEDFDVVFTSDYLIEDANCDSKNLVTGEYVWSFKKGTLGKTIEFTLTDNKNYSAIVFGKIGYLILPIILLVILLICYIIYSNFKKKVMIVNEI